MYKVLPILLFAYGLAITTDDIYDNSYALIIGIDKYENVSNLDYAVKDAKSITTLLRDNFNFPSNNIKTLLNDEATFLNIRNSLAEISKVGKANDRILIYFAGHGETEDLPDGGEMGYLLPIDGIRDNLFATSIPMDDLKRISSLSSSKHMLFLIDACYGGLAATGARGLSSTTPNFIDKITNDKSRQIITAGGRGEEVLEKSEWGHSAFTMNLIRALENGKADLNADGYITGDELGLFLKEKVTIDSKNQQTPQSRRFTSHEGEFVFINNSSPAIIIHPQGNSVSLNQKIEEIKIEIEELKYQGVTAIDDKPIDEYADSLINEIKLEEAAGTNKSSFNNIIMELEEKIALLESKLETPTKLIQGCTNQGAVNYNPEANIDDNSCVVLGYNSAYLKLGNFSSVDSTLDIYIHCGTLSHPLMKNTVRYIENTYKLSSISLKIEGFEIIKLIEGELVYNNFSTKRISSGLFGKTTKNKYLFKTKKNTGAMFAPQKEILLLKAKVNTTKELLCIKDVDIASIPNDNIFIGDCLSIKLKGSGFLSIYYKSDSPIAGFQFNLSGVNIMNASLGAAQDASFMISNNLSTIIGFSLDGNIIPPGENLLTIIHFEGNTSDVLLKDVIVSDQAGNESDAILDIRKIIYE